MRNAMKKTDLFTLLQLGPINEGEIIFRHNDNYVVAKMTAIQYNAEAGNYATFTIEGIVTND